MGTEAAAQDAANKDDNPSDSVQVGIMSDSPDDPESLLHSIDHRKTQKSSLISVPALHRAYEATDKGRDKLYEATGLKLGLALTHVFQGLSESPLAEDTTWGTATTFDFLGTWELIDRGGPYQGQLFFQVRGPS